MAVELKRGDNKIDITLTNGHIPLLEKIRERYGLNNHAQALDFVLKAAGDSNERAETITINGISYKPGEYGRE